MHPFLSILKIVGPYLAPIIQAVIPAFTKKPSEKADPVVTQQISELQEAAQKNSASIKALAQAIEEAAKANDRAVKRANLIAMASAIIAIFALVVAILLWLK